MNQYSNSIPCPKDEETLVDVKDTDISSQSLTSQKEKTLRNGARDNSRKFIGWTRFMAVVPVIGLFISALALTVFTLISTVLVTFNAIIAEITIQDMLVEYIEYADFFLLAIVLYIMSIGLYSLFIDDNVDMPDWLEIHNLDDLKEKLIAVIAVVMAVYFLGRLIHGASPEHVVLLGIGIGAVIMSLAYFVKHVMGFKHK